MNLHDQYPSHLQGTSLHQMADPSQQPAPAQSSESASLAEGGFSLVEMIVGLLAILKAGALPVVIGGDLNDVWSSLSKKLMQPSEFINASEYSKTFPAWFPMRALDGIYYRGNLQLTQCNVHRSDLAKKASDHLPLLAEFQTLLPGQDS